MLNLDTHILLFALQGELSKKEHQLLSSRQWGISAIVIWEIAKLKQLKKIEIGLDDLELQKVFSQIQVWPISIEVCRKLSGLDFKSDPADEMIAATSLVYQVPLLTRDRKILRSKLIPFAK